jgi:tRNA A-37 threonylcarbamoyl transferase component Bud32
VTSQEANRTELGNFELISRLGQGGMGAVYKARQKSMDRIVALKILPKNLARNQAFIERFLREARAAGKLTHASIVTGIDAGVVDGYYYFAMEYVDGRNLGDRVRADGPLPEDEVVEIGRQIADALEYAHSRGLVHRDVKPENILVTGSGLAKLCDLGLARSSGSDDDQRLTQAGCAVGTPYYISPEQVRGEEPDARADIYALGCTLYHLLTGRPPFQGSSPLGTMQMHLTATAPSLTEVNPENSRAMEAVIERMMARAMSERYQTARSVAEEFSRMAAGGIPVALATALADRRKGAAKLATTRKGLGSSTAATHPVGPRGVRTALEAAIGEDATGQTRALAVVGHLKPWQLLVVFIVGALVAGGGGFLGIKWLRDRKKPPDTAVVTGPVEPVPAEDPLKALREKLARIKAYEDNHPQDFVGILTLYEGLLQEKGVEGSDVETTARRATAQVKKRQAAQLLDDRLRLLAAEMEKVRAFEAANQEKIDEIVERYTKFGQEAQGTEFEAKAKAATEEARKQHGARAAARLADLDKRVAADCAAGKFGAALTSIDGFPKGYASAVERSLAALREKVLAAGRERWRGLLEECRKLVASKRFDEAAATAARAKTFGLSDLDAEVTAALAEVDAARGVAEQARNAAAEKAFKKYGDDLPGLCAQKQYAEARKQGEKLVGTLTAELEAKLRAELALIAGAEGFMKELRTGLRGLKPDTVKLVTGLGDGFLQSFDPAEDELNVKVSVGNASVINKVKLAAVAESDLVRLAAKSSGGELSARAARGAACMLLTNRKTAGVRELLDKAAKGGEKVDDLAPRLDALEKAAAPAPAPAPAAE